MGLNAKLTETVCSYAENILIKVQVGWMAQIFWLRVTWLYGSGINKNLDDPGL